MSEIKDEGNRPTDPPTPKYPPVPATLPEPDLEAGTSVDEILSTISMSLLDGKTEHKSIAIRSALPEEVAELESLLTAGEIDQIIFNRALRTPISVIATLEAMKDPLISDLKVASLKKDPTREDWYDIVFEHTAVKALEVSKRIVNGTPIPGVENIRDEANKESYLKMVEITELPDMVKGVDSELLSLSDFQSALESSGDKLIALRAIKTNLRDRKEFLDELQFRGSLVFNITVGNQRFTCHGTNLESTGGRKVEITLTGASEKHVLYVEGDGYICSDSHSIQNFQDSENLTRTPLSISIRDVFDALN